MSTDTNPSPYSSVEEFNNEINRRVGGMDKVFSHIATDLTNWLETPDGQSSLLDRSVLYDMIGYPYPIDSEIQPAISWGSYSTSRTYNFFNFWNQDSTFNFNTLGDDFINFTNFKLKETGSSQTNPKNKQDSQVTLIFYLNIFISYILVLAFNGLLSSPDGVNISNPMDIFTPDSDVSKFNRASVNLSTFVSKCAGMGNGNILEFSKNTSMSDLETSWNKGFVSYYCTKQFEDYCSGQKLSTTDQKCIMGFRNKLSNSPVAVNWCGCFSPLPKYMEDVFSSVDNKHSCDSFCYRSGSIKLYTTPGNDTDGLDSLFAIKCKGKACIIDNNSINSNNSTGSINFENICSCEQGDICRCYIDTSTPGLLDNVSNGQGQGMLSTSTFYQKCTNAYCFNINPETGIQNTVPCNSVSPGQTGDVFQKNIDGFATTQNNEKIDSTFWIFISFIFIVFIMYQFSFLEIKLS